MVGSAAQPTHAPQPHASWLCVVQRAAHLADVKAATKFVLQRSPTQQQAVLVATRFMGTRGDFDESSALDDGHALGKLLTQLTAGAGHAHAERACNQRGHGCAGVRRWP